MDAFCLHQDGQKTALASEEFHHRVSRIPRHGIGLSIDLYVPDALDLVEALEQRGMTYDYLELFKASTRALARLRRRLPSAALEYHGEGVWLTQPDLLSAYPCEGELRAASAHVEALGSSWVNYECATKQMAGYSFGTYLPPLFTREAAVVTARNARYVQGSLDRAVGDAGGLGPLLLVELPPLTYFKIGELPVQDFFRTVTESAPCGLVLDVGHLWTVYRYAGDATAPSVHHFVEEFLDGFPLDRVVQIHVAGLGPGAAAKRAHAGRLERAGPWIDAHGSPIPGILFDMLDQILAHPQLRSLRGVALEVDTKPVERIVAEFERFGKRYAAWARALVRESQSEQRRMPHEHMPGRGAQSAELYADALSARVLEQYGTYARVASGRAAHSPAFLPHAKGDPALLALYRRSYLPHEILAWGGDLRDVFPETCRRLDAGGIALVSFVEFWFRGPRRVTEPYDFFLLKLERFVEFVSDVLPSSVEYVRREAEEMRAAYRAASEWTTVPRE